MNIDDLKLSDSTLGVLRKRGYGVDVLLEHRDDLTILDGIGPGRANEIARALDEVVDRVAPVAVTEAAQDEEGGGEPAPAPFAPPEGSLVRYVDRSGNQMMARVAKNREDGTLNLQVFTGAGGAHRVEGVGRGSEWPQPGTWFPAESP